MSVVKELPRVMVKGKEYFIDARLEEIRDVKRPWVSISFDDDVIGSVLDELTGKPLWALLSIEYLNVVLNGGV